MGSESAGKSNGCGGHESRAHDKEKSSAEGGPMSRGGDGQGESREAGGRARGGDDRRERDGLDSGRERSVGGRGKSSEDGMGPRRAPNRDKNITCDGRKRSVGGKQKNSVDHDRGERINEGHTVNKYNANGLRLMDCSTCSWDAKGQFHSNNADYDVKDWRAILERKNDVIVSVDKTLGIVGISDCNIQSLHGLEYKAGCEESYSKYFESRDRQKGQVNSSIRRLHAKAVIDARARTSMNAIVSNLRLSTITRESILSVEDNISPCGRFEKRPAQDLCRHLFEHAHDNPGSGDIYSKSNLLRAFDCIVDAKTYDRFGSENPRQGSVHDFSCKCVLMLTAINDGTIAHLSIEDSILPLTKQGNDAIITVRGGRCYDHQDTTDLNCPICIAAQQPRGEPFEFKASLVDPSKQSTTASTRRKQQAATIDQNMNSEEIPAVDVRHACQCQLNVGNMFAFAIFTVIFAPEQLIGLHGNKPCRLRSTGTHDSDHCQTCLNSYSRNLRTARVAVSSLPFAIAVTCIVIQQHEESAKIADGEGLPRDCKCRMSITSSNLAKQGKRYRLHPEASRVCEGINQQLRKEFRKPIPWTSATLLRRGTNPLGQSTGGFAPNGMRYAFPNNNSTRSMNHLLQSECGLQQVCTIGFGGLVSIVRSGRQEATDLFDPQEMYTAVHARDTRSGEDRETREEVRGAARGKSKSDGEAERHAEVETIDDVIRKSDGEEAASDYESEESEEEWTESGAEE